MAVYCRRCGNRFLLDPQFCAACADGEADPDRARAILRAAEAGSEDALRMLGTIDDRRAVPILLEAAQHPRAEIRRAAILSLGWAADARALPAAIEGLADDIDGVRLAALDCLAELGSPAAADALASHLADPRDAGATATALAWLKDPRAFDPLIAALDRPYDSGNVNRGSIMAFGWLADRRAVPPLAAALERMGDRWVAAEGQAPPRPDWAAHMLATSIANALMLIGGAEAAVDHAQRRIKALRISIPVRADLLPFAYRAPADDRRSVARWSLDLQPRLMPVDQPVTKFGGQPVWLGIPTWPLGSDGEPMTFMAQFSVPGVEGLAYLFIDYSEEVWASPYDGSALLMQPGPPPDRHIVQALGPTYTSQISEADRYVPRMRTRRTEYLPILEEGREPADWRAFDRDRDDDRDDDRDWNKIGGSPRYLQGGPPDPAGLRFLFQFTANHVGHELGDAAHCYGLIDGERRGFFLIESH
jgi:HEAT repeat protein/uncharacterized protein DUF1963/PBS lyase HEAT-like repeat-containing protein